MIKKSTFGIIGVLFVVLAITVGFSAFGNKGTITGTAVVRLQEEVRITNVAYTTAASSGSSNYAEHGLSTMLGSVTLPNASSTVTYTVQVTNFGNVPAALYAINNLPSNLTYSLSGYTLKSDICDTSGNCSLGAVKEFTITIGYTSSGYNSSSTTYALSLAFDFREIYTITWAKYNLFTNLGDKGTTNGGRMNYSISNDVVTVTATADDGYGYIPYRAYLEAGKTYVFNMSSSGTYGTVSGADTVQAFLMLDGSTSTAYYHMGSDSQYQFTPTVTGTYWLRLDVNKNGATHTFRNISIGEVVGTSRIADQETFGTTMPTISKTGYTFTGWYDSLNRDSRPSTSQFTSTTKYTAKKSQILYGYLKPTTTYTVSYNANGGSGAPSAQTKTIDRNLTLTTSQPTRTNYAFKGWGTSAGATAIAYSPGSIYSTNASTTLYALWNFSLSEDYSGSADQTGGFFTYSAPVETDGDGVFQWSRSGSTWRTNTDDTGDWPWNSSTVNVESTISFTPPVNSTFTFNWGVSSTAFEYIGIRLNITGSDGSYSELENTDDASYSSGSETVTLTAGVKYSLYVKLMFPSWYDNTFMWLDDFKIVQR